MAFFSSINILRYRPMLRAQLKSAVYIFSVLTRHTYSATIKVWLFCVHLLVYILNNTTVLLCAFDISVLCLLFPTQLFRSCTPSGNFIKYINLTWYHSEIATAEKLPNRTLASWQRFFKSLLNSWMQKLRNGKPKKRIFKTITFCKES